MKRWLKPVLLVGAVALLVALLWRPVENHLDAAAFLLRFEGEATEPQGFASWGVHPFDVEDFEWDRGRARLYAPRDDDDPPGVVLVHGVHARGIDEERLAHFAAAMATAGLAVMTPEIEALTEYRIEEDPTSTFIDAAAALAAHLGHARVGVVGVSFSGGLALIAASRLRGAPPIGWVLSVGGHHDLLRVARFYTGGEIEGPAGDRTLVEPHPYGAGVLIYAHVEEMFPPEDTDAAREALRTLLHDRWREAREKARALRTAAGRQRMRAVLDRGDPGRDELGTALLAVLDRHRDGLGRISPRDNLSGVDVPVYLLHGDDDPVVPSVETEWLEREVPEDALEATLITAALRHAEYEREPTARERWDLVHFMAAVLTTARTTD